jgi:hypothetical protein
MFPRQRLGKLVPGEMGDRKENTTFEKDVPTATVPQNGPKGKRHTYALSYTYTSGFIYIE